MTRVPDPEQTAALIYRAAPQIEPRIGIVLGSGLGGLADRVEGAVTLPYSELPGFPQPTVSGHRGELVLGTLSGVPVAVMSGRTHAYEGRIDGMVLPIRTLKQLGCEALYLTNAAGGLTEAMAPGRLMAITDHINLLGGNPLVGPNDDRFGPRFPSLDGAYDPELLDWQRREAATLDIDLGEGVYAAALGPNFETPAEVRMMRTLGAHAVGMSTVAETIVARHCGLRVTATSLIVNYGVGLSDMVVDHDVTLKVAECAGALLQDLIAAVVGRFA